MIQWIPQSALRTAKGFQVRPGPQFPLDHGMREWTEPPGCSKDSSALQPGTLGGQGSAMDSVMPFTAPTPEGTSRWSKGPLTTTPYFITVLLMLMLMIGALMVPSCVWEQLQPPPLLRHSVLALLVIAHGATKGVSRGVNKGVTTALSAALVAAAPLTSEAVQLPEASTLMRCDVQDGYNEWNGRSDAWRCSGGVVVRV
mmetsp:Transcript_39450/g.125906  ORF Transcript_39450/g.125906 Transcript_39450/m.125906 type:complete len:199 (+) Transcript_39450:141-737(+)